MYSFILHLDQSPPLPPPPPVLPFIRHFTRIPPFSRKDWTFPLGRDAEQLLLLIRVKMKKQDASAHATAATCQLSVAIMNGTFKNKLFCMNIVSLCSIQFVLLESLPLHIPTAQPPLRYPDWITVGPSRDSGGSGRNQHSSFLASEG